MDGKIILDGYDLIVMSGTYKEKHEGAHFASAFQEQGQPVILIGDSCYDNVLSISADIPDFDGNLIRMIEELLKEEGGAFKEKTQTKRILKGCVFTLPKDSKRWRACLCKQQEYFHRNKNRRRSNILYVASKDFAGKSKRYTSAKVRVDKKGEFKLGGSQAIFVRS